MSDGWTQATQSQLFGMCICVSTLVSLEPHLHSQFRTKLYRSQLRSSYICLLSALWETCTTILCLFWLVVLVVRYAKRYYPNLWLFFFNFQFWILRFTLISFKMRFNIVSYTEQGLKDLAPWKTQRHWDNSVGHIFFSALMCGYQTELTKNRTFLSLLNEDGSYGSNWLNFRLKQLIS